MVLVLKKTVETDNMRMGERAVDVYLHRHLVCVRERGGLLSYQQCSTLVCVCMYLVFLVWFGEHGLWYNLASKYLIRVHINELITVGKATL